MVFVHPTEYIIVSVANMLCIWYTLVCPNKKRIEKQGFSCPECTMRNLGSHSVWIYPVISGCHLDFEPVVLSPWESSGNEKKCCCLPTLVTYYFFCPGTGPQVFFYPHEKKNCKGKCTSNWLGCHSTYVTEKKKKNSMDITVRMVVHIRSQNVF